MVFLSIGLFAVALIRKKIETELNSFFDHHSLDFYNAFFHQFQAGSLSAPVDAFYHFPFRAFNQKIRCSE
jgi:hypothetical protein